MKYLELHSGDQLPALGLGTWKAETAIARDAVKAAIDLGYRHIDCAAIYGNESGIGDALVSEFSNGKVKREELWITSKLWNNAHKAEDVRPALLRTLQDLKIDYLDLYLIHWPVVFKPEFVFPDNDAGYLSLDEVPILETWQAMEACVDEGLLRNIGVSNFSPKKLGELYNKVRIKPAVDQVELHPLLQQPALKDYCDSKGIILTAYSPLGSADRPAFFRSEDAQSPLELETIREIAASRQLTPAQILLAWALNRGTAAIPKSVRPERMRENLAAADITLNADEMAAIKALDRHYRLLTGDIWKGPNTPQTLWDE